MPFLRTSTTIRWSTRARARKADSIRRRRECLKCEKRFTTYERIDEIPYMVVKKDGRREKFERQKVLNGLLRACEKRPVPIGKLEQIVNEAESFVIDSAERERKTSEIGELIMNRLRRLRQSCLRALCLGLSGFQGRAGVHERTEGPAETQGDAQ